MLINKLRPSENKLSDGLLISQQLFCQLLIDLLIKRGEIGFADKSLQQLAFFVDKKRGRIHLGAECFAHAAVGIIHHGKRQAAAGGIVFDAFQRVERLRNGENLESLPA